MNIYFLPYFFREIFILLGLLIYYSIIIHSPTYFYIKWLIRCFVNSIQFFPSFVINFHFAFIHFSLTILLLLLNLLYFQSKIYTFVFISLLYYVSSHIPPFILYYVRKILQLSFFIGIHNPQSKFIFIYFLIHIFALIINQIPSFIFVLLPQIAY